MGLFNWIKEIKDKRNSWVVWKKQLDDLTAFKKAERYINLWQRRDQEDAERASAGLSVPIRMRNYAQPKLKYCLDLYYRRVPGGAGEGSIGGAYRTMSNDEFEGSRQQRMSDAHYLSLVPEDKEMVPHDEKELSRW